MFKDFRLELKTHSPIMLAIQLLVLVTIFLILVFYRIGFDLLMIVLVLGAAWCLGSFFETYVDITTRPLLQLSSGLAVLGLAFYWLLILGFGGETQYILLLLPPILIWYAKGGRLKCPNMPTKRAMRVVLGLLAVLGLLMIAYSSAPIQQYDALTGHLPITMYAARNGSFNINIAESFTYTQTGMLLYGYSAVFATFGAFKALAMFNVILLFLIFATLYLFARKIYEQTNLLVFALLFFSVPMFFEFSTIFYVEMLPIYFTLSGFTMFVELKPEQGWQAMPRLGLLFGCAVISKLTISYTILAGGLVVIALFFVYVIKEKIKLLKIFQRAMLSLTIFCGLLAVPFGVAWHHFGNPVFPWFNGIFQSPYFPASNFVDPFSNSTFGFSFSSILKMIFLTNNNIEMHDGGLGIYLLLLPLVPISWLIRRNLKLCVWGLVPLASYIVSTLFTYNLRYYMAIFMLAAVMISISVCILLNQILKNRGNFAAIILACIIAMPGVLYICRYYPLQTNLTQVSNEISQSPFSNLLKEIPSQKRVFCSESFKGDYDGYLTPNTWHGRPWMAMLNILGSTEAEFLTSFDYFICDTASEEQMALLNRCASSGLMRFEERSTQGTYKLYEIYADLHFVGIAEESFDVPRQVNSTAPCFSIHAVEPEQAYQIAQTLIVPVGNTVLVRPQVVWTDKENNVIEVSTEVVEVEGGNVSQEISSTFTAPKDASTGCFYFGIDQTGNNLLVEGYQIDIILEQKTDIVQQMETVITSRSLLKK